MIFFKATNDVSNKASTNDVSNKASTNNDKYYFDNILNALYILLNLILIYGFITIDRPINHKINNNLFLIILAKLIIIFYPNFSILNKFTGLIIFSIVFIFLNLQKLILLKKNKKYLNISLYDDLFNNKLLVVLALVININISYGNFSIFNIIYCSVFLIILYNFNQQINTISNNCKLSEEFLIIIILLLSDSYIIQIGFIIILICLKNINQLKNKSISFLKKNLIKRAGEII